MVRRNSIEASTRSSMADFDNSELIHISDNSDQASLRFLSGVHSRLVQTTSEHSAKLDSMAEMLLEVKNTLSQLSNQLGIHPIDAEFSQHFPPTTDEHTEKFDSMEALLRELKQAPSIEIPEFDASNVSDWLSKVERSFRVRRYSDLDKLNLVAFRLEGAVLNWFNWEMTRREFRSWDEFRRRLLLRFGPAPAESTGNRLFAIKQTGTVSASVTELEELSAQVIEQQPVYKEESITHLQVPVSSWEPSLSFSSEILDVSVAWPSDIVSTNRVHSHSVLDCVKNKTNAYQVFDKTSHYTERLNPRTKRKLRLSLKTWMFKFKHTSKKRKSLDVKFFSVEEIAWLMRDSKGIYRSCVDKEFKSVVAGCGNKLFDRFQTSPSYALDVVNKTSKPWETHTTFTSTHVASVNSLSFEVDNFELCVGHDRDIMRLKLLLHSGCDGEKLTELDFHFGVTHGLLVFPWNLMLLEFFLFLHLEDKVCLSAASNSCYGWMVFDRGKNNIISGDVITLERDGQTVLLVKAKDAHVDSLIVRIKELWIANMVEINTGVFWAELKWIIWSVSSNIVEVYTKIIDKLQIQLKQGMNLHGASWHCSSDEMNRFHSPIGLVDALYSGLGENVHALLAAEVHESGQQQSSSIWHRWRRKDCTRTSIWVFPLQFSFFKLEDKLV